MGSFNQRARDSSSLERTKIPRGIIRFLVGFSFFRGSAHFCTLFARSVLSMSDDVGRCIALQSVPFFASGEQFQAQLCLHCSALNPYQKQYGLAVVWFIRLNLLACHAVNSRLRSAAMKAPVGLSSGSAVLHSKMVGHCPDKLGGICDRECQGLQGASRWFCKFYCRNAVIVGLIARRSSAFPFNQCISAF